MVLLMSEERYGLQERNVMVLGGEELCGLL